MTPFDFLTGKGVKLPAYAEDWLTQQGWRVAGEDRLVDADGNRIKQNEDTGYGYIADVIRGQPTMIQKNGKTYFPMYGNGPADIDTPEVRKAIGGDFKAPDFIQDDNGEWLQSTDVMKKMNDALGIGSDTGSGFFGRGGFYGPFSKSVGLMMGLGNLAGAGLTSLAAGGSETAASFLPEGGYQSLFSSLTGQNPGGLKLATDYEPGLGANDIETPWGTNQRVPYTGEGTESGTMNNLTAGGIGLAGAGTALAGAAGGGDAAAELAAKAAQEGITSTGGNASSAGLISRLTNGTATAADYATALGVGGGIAALAKSVSGGGLGGNATQTTSSQFPPMSDEEKQLIALNAELTKRQLAAIDQLQPFQKAMLEAAMEELNRAKNENTAISGAVSPEEQAAQVRAEFERSKRLGPIQDEILQMQLDNLRRNGAATPEQEALIKGATDSAISSANADVDASTSRGIGLIADELANSRGLRLSDSPMSGEAALLAREGVIQKGGIEKSLRANEANAKLNYPLAVSELSSKMSQVPLSVADAAKTFQDNLRQRAFQNRMTLIGQGANTGIGLASTGGGNAALSALTQNRLNSGTQTVNSSRGIGLSDYGSLASGIGGLLTAGSRLGFLS